MSVIEIHYRSLLGSEWKKHRHQTFRRGTVFLTAEHCGSAAAHCSFVPFAWVTLKLSHSHSLFSSQMQSQNCFSQNFVQIAQIGSLHEDAHRYVNALLSKNISEIKRRREIIITLSWITGCIRIWSNLKSSEVCMCWFTHQMSLCVFTGPSLADVPFRFTFSQKTHKHTALHKL